MERIEGKGVAALAEQAVRGLPQSGRGAENMLPSVKAAPVVAFWVMPALISLKLTAVVKIIFMAVKTGTK